MALLFEQLYLDLLAILVGFSGILVWYLNNNFDYWKKRGVFYLKPEPFFGNTRDVTLLRKSLAKAVEELYVKLGNEKFGGFYENRVPILLLKDPDTIKTIMVKDFPYFQDRGFNLDPEVNPLSENLFFMGGPNWRALRTKLTPTFTSGKIKMMYNLIEECSEQLTKFLGEAATNCEIIDVRESLAKYSTDVIGTCAFGIQCNAMQNPDSEFRKRGKEIFEPDLVKAVKRIFIRVFPTVAKQMRVNTMSKDSMDFFLTFVKETVEYRLKNNITRNDFLQLLIELQKNGKVADENEKNSKILNNHAENQNGYGTEDKYELTDGRVAAQVFIFFLAGFETSSTAMSCALTELAMNPDIQARLREEIDTVLQDCKGKVTYDALQKMEYLDKVVCESMRKYPPLMVLNRECTIPYNFPGTDIKLEKGTKLIIPVSAIQHDPKYYPDPERFDPERFSPENKEKRHHYVYLPFGEGPRICIGMRFGLLQTKMGLFKLLANYEFSVSEKTLIPLKIDPKTSITTTFHGTSLRIMNRRN